MADPQYAREQPPLARLIAHLNNPLYRNGYALILSVVSTSGLGFIYWILAARTYKPDTVGLNSAAISAMMFLGGIAQLNLASALIRFTPVAGRQTLRFITTTYCIGIAAAALISAVFLLGLERWAPALGFLRSKPTFALWFILATIGWCVFVLQDSALIGLREATWVPIENTIFAVGKIILMVAFAVIIPMFGLYASWTAALAVSVIFTNLIIFRRVLPRALPALRLEESRLDVPGLVRYIAADYVGALSWLGATTLLPLIVTTRAGTTANGYFFLAWQTAFLLYSVSASMGSSLVVEAAANPGQLMTFTVRVALQILLLLIPGVSLILIAAPFILSIFGSDYAAQASPLLRLLALSALPYMVNSLFISVCRVRRRMVALMVTLVTMCALILSLSELFIGIYGIAGVGLAWLIGQGTVAFAVLVTQVRPLVKTGQLELPRPGDLRSLLLKFPLLKEQPVTTEGPEEFISSQSLVQSEFEDAGIPVTAGPPIQPDVAAVTALNRTARKVRPALGARRSGQERVDPLEQALVSRLLAAVLPEIRSSNGLPDPRSWEIHRAFPTVTDLVVYPIGPAASPPAALLKLARTQRGAAAIQRQAENLAALNVDTRLGGWRRLLPEVLFAGRREEHEVAVERLLPGTTLTHLLASQALIQPGVQAAVTAIEKLHLSTARLTSLDSEDYRLWAVEPIARIRALKLPLSSREVNDRALDRLAGELQDGLAGKCTTVSWIHGDYAPDNILVAPDGSAVSGIVDWELAHPDGLPGLDLLQLLVTTRMAGADREFGEVVRNLLYRADWTPVEQRIFDRMRRVFPGDPVAPRTLLLLCWLQHIDANITKSDRYAGHWVWKTANIEPVLRIL